MYLNFWKKYFDPSWKQAESYKHLNLTNEQGEGRSEQHFHELIFHLCQELTLGFPEPCWAKFCSQEGENSGRAAVTLIHISVTDGQIQHLVILTSCSHLRELKCWGISKHSPTSGSGNFWSSPKPCWEGCLHCRLLADSNGQISEIK